MLGDDANVTSHRTNLQFCVRTYVHAIAGVCRHLQPHIDHWILQKVNQRRQQMTGIEGDRKSLGCRRTNEAVPAATSADTESVTGDAPRGIREPVLVGRRPSEISNYDLQIA